MERLVMKCAGCGQPTYNDRGVVRALRRYCLPCDERLFPQPEWVKRAKRQGFVAKDYTGRGPAL